MSRLVLILHLLHYRETLIFLSAFFDESLEGVVVN
jgi:hypothetical protein